MAIEIKQRIKCGSCRAYSSGIGAHCTLGYYTKHKKELFGITVDSTPLEPCPKPLTIGDLVDASQNYRRS